MQNASGFLEPCPVAFFQANTFLPSAEVKRDVANTTVSTHLCNQAHGQSETPLLRERTSPSASSVCEQAKTERREAVLQDTIQHVAPRGVTLLQSALRQGVNFDGDPVGIAGNGFMLFRGCDHTLYVWVCQMQIYQEPFTSFFRSVRVPTPVPVRKPSAGNLITTLILCEFGFADPISTKM